MKSHRFDLLALAGISVLEWGLWQAWPPLALVFLGLLLVIAAALGVLLSRRAGPAAAPPPEPQPED